MKARSKWSLWLLVAGFALLSSLPFLADHTGILIVTAFVPLFFLDKFLTEGKIRHPFIYIYTAFLIFNAATTWWVWNASAIGSVAAIALNALQMAAIFALYRWAAREYSVRCRRRQLEGRICALLFLAVTWTAWEHLYYELEIAWPWLALGNALSTSTHLAQWYDIFGTQGGTLWILLCNSAIFLALDARSTGERKWLAGTAAALVIIPCALSVTRYCTYTEERESTIEIVVVQPNIDPYDKFGVIPQEDIETRTIELFREKITPETDFIITPETFTYNIDIDHPNGHPSIVRFQNFLADYPETDLLLGAMTYRRYTSTLQPTVSARHAAGARNWYDSFNTAMVMDRDTIYGHYFKSRLVPGVERIPYARYLSFIAPLFEKFGGSATSYGTQSDMEPVKAGNGHSVGAIICYESIFGDYCSRAAGKGADFLAIITNDGWWGDTPGHIQHLRFAKLRAIESRRDVVFAANTGISAVIDQKGDIRGHTGYWEETVLDATLSTNTEATPFARKGDVTGRLMCQMFLMQLFTIILLKFASALDRKSSNGATA